ncbi:MAG: PorP/SprF family type IX secretion system membrane protein [Bacteroidetes bacterium]|nr:PorP/SprF family type IX secretion system membrane protein [Bacteroidota bacterium]
MQRLYVTISLFLLLGCGALRAQVQPMFSQYMHDATIINPAYAGSAEALALTLQARLQWTQTAGAPAVQILAAHTPLPGLPLSAGLRLLHEVVGSGRRMSVSPALVHRIRLGKGSIAGGLSANINHYTPGYENLLLYNEADKAFTLRESVWVVTLGAGLYYATDRFYVGFSVPEIVPASRPDPERNIFGRHLRQYAFHTGKVITLSHDVKLKPNLLLSVPEEGVTYADMNLNALFRETLWLGVSYRTTNLLGGLVQLQLNDQWRLGYAWDMPLKGNHYYGADSHEISLQYVFSFDRTGVRSPRYF